LNAGEPKYDVELIAICPVRLRAILANPKIKAQLAI
jgi:hypothetical protein